MRAVIQLVNEAYVTVGDTITGSIGNGLVILLGISKKDTKKDITFLREGNSSSATSIFNLLVNKFLPEWNRNKNF